MKVLTVNHSRRITSAWRIIGTTLLGFIFVMGVVAIAEAKENEKPSEYELPLYKVEDLTLPIPSNVVVPRVGMSLVGTEIIVTFRVSETGQPNTIRDDALFNISEKELAIAMRNVLKRWEFEPARNEQGIAVPVKVRLPVEVVRSGEGNAHEYASIVVGTPTIVAKL